MSMDHDSMIAVIQAHKEGKEIQYIDIERGDGENDWRDRATKSPSFDFGRFDYRIKPEPRKPREIWVNEYDSSDRWGYVTNSPLGHLKRDDGTFIATRKFIEVIEEEEA